MVNDRVTGTSDDGKIATPVTVVAEEMLGGVNV